MMALILAILLIGHLDIKLWRRIEWIQVLRDVVSLSVRRAKNSDQPKPTIAPSVLKRHNQ